MNCSVAQSLEVRDSRSSMNASISPEVLWENTERVFCRLAPGHSPDRSYAFMPAQSGSAHPLPESIDRLAHEFELRDHLDCAWALRPQRLIRERGRTMLTVEYTAGEPLDRLIRGPMEIGAFLRFAVSLTTALGRLHAAVRDDEKYRPERFREELAALGRTLGR
jgi:hypothetical protein